MKTIIEQIIKSINSFIADDFQPNPFNFLYEADIQSAMWAKLKNELDLKVRWEVEDEEIIKKIGKKAKGAIETNIVKTQYPNKPKRFDLGIIHPDSRKVVKKGDRLERFWDQPLLLAIELKYLQYGFNPEKVWEKFINDIEQLEKLKEEFKDRWFRYGLALLFVQSDYPMTKMAGLNLRLVDGIGLASDVAGYVISEKEIYQIIR
jgi:hypothetical protein